MIAAALVLSLTACENQYIVDDGEDGVVGSDPPAEEEEVDTSMWDGATISYSPATATDDPNPTPLITYSVASGMAFPVGATSVIATATDVAGLSSTCSFTVNVIREE